VEPSLIVSLVKGESPGPFVGIGLSHRQAALVAWLTTVWRIGRMPGHVLHNKPVFEAREIFANRLSSVATRTGDLPSFGLEVLVSLGGTITEVPNDVALWWRREASLCEPPEFRALKSRLSLSEIVVAVAAVNEHLWEKKSNV
jgi:hypothetical protein